MAGRLTRGAPSEGSHKHDHFVLKTKNWRLNFNDYRQFGRVYLHPKGVDPLAALPIEILAPKFTSAHVDTICEKRAKRSLKGVLLDQLYFPGVGNWMADEICWRMGRDPATPLGEVNSKSVWKETRMVARGAMRHVADANSNQFGSSKGFRPGNYVHRVPPKSWLFQHRWKPGGTVSSVQSGTVERSRCHSHHSLVWHMPTELNDFKNLSAHKERYLNATI